jgi:hypothetical protein
MPITDSARIQTTTIKQHRTKNKNIKKNKKTKKSKSAKAI